MSWPRSSRGCRPRRPRRSDEPPMIAALALAATLAASVVAAPTHRIVPLRGIRMYVRLEGQGPPLLLLHGGAGNGLQFERQLPSFTKRYRCIVPDLCGQGRTSDRDAPLTHEAMAEDVVAIMDS